MTEVFEAAMLLAGEGVDEKKLSFCVDEAIWEVCRYCGVADLPTGCVEIAVRRALFRYQGEAVTSLKRGDYSVTFADGGEDAFFQALQPFRQLKW